MYTNAYLKIMFLLIIFRVGVTLLPCEFPYIDVSENDCFDGIPCTDDTRDIYRSIDAVAKSRVVINCPGRTVNYTVSLFKVWISTIY